MDRHEFNMLCILNNINIDSIIVGYNNYIIDTNKNTFEYQSFIYYNMLADSYSEYNIEYNDIKKLIKKEQVVNIRKDKTVQFIDIKSNRRFLWFKLKDKYNIEDINLFFKYNVNS